MLLSQATLSEEAKEVYNSLVESSSSGIAESPDTNPLRMLRSGLPIMRVRVRGNKHASSHSVTGGDDDHHHPHHQVIIKFFFFLIIFSN